jgi:hypothetical protein
MELDVLCMLHFIPETQRSIPSTAVKNSFVKCDFSNDHVSRNEDSAVKLGEDEEDDSHSLQPLGVQFEDCRRCDIALEVCGILSVSQVLDQHLTMSEEEPEGKRKQQNIK